jgi:outer membrane lipoprotein SlyB
LYGAIAGPLGSLIIGGIGATLGAVGGLVVGAVAGPIKNAATHTDEELKKATEALALSVQEGVTDTDFDSMKNFLVAQGVAADEAEVLAESFAMDTEALLEFGEATQASKAAIEA